LISKGANVNHGDFRRHTALHYAKKLQRDRAVEILLENGAINTKDGRITKTKTQPKVQPKKKPVKIFKRVYKLQVTDETGNKRDMT